MSGAASFIWVHEDMLRADHPAFADGGPAFFIWDDAYLADMGYGLKRRVFIYETLAELPLSVIAGPLRETLQALAAEAGASEIITGKTPNPQLKAVMTDLRAGLKVTPRADDPFVQMDAQPDLRRFFKYWNKAKKRAFLFDGRP